MYYFLFKQKWKGLANMSMPISQPSEDCEILEDVIAGLEYGPDYNYPIPKYNEEPFTSEDDEILMKLILQFGTKFEKIGKLLNNRSPAAVKNRYMMIKRNKKLQISVKMRE